MDPFARYVNGYVEFCSKWRKYCLYGATELRCLRVVNPLIPIIGIYFLFSGLAGPQWGGWIVMIALGVVLYSQMTPTGQKPPTRQTASLILSIPTSGTPAWSCTSHPGTAQQ